MRQHRALSAQRSKPASLSSPICRFYAMVKIDDKAYLRYGVSGRLGYIIMLTVCGRMWNCVDLRHVGACIF